MSDSYKKNLFVKETSEFGKKQANKKVRRFYKNKDFIDDRAYDKKLASPDEVIWERYEAPTYEEHKEWCRKNKPNMNEKEIKRKYYNLYLNK